MGRPQHQQAIPALNTVPIHFMTTYNTSTLRTWSSKLTFLLAYLWHRFTRMQLELLRGQSVIGSNRIHQPCLLSDDPSLAIDPFPLPKALHLLSSSKQKMQWEHVCLLMVAVA
jgi:hypothetical protein